MMAGRERNARRGADASVTLKRRAGPGRSGLISSFPSSILPIISQEPCRIDILPRNDLYLLRHQPIYISRLERRRRRLKPIFYSSTNTPFEY
jgi:hypothetical protein